MSIKKNISRWVGKLDEVHVEPFLAFGNGKDLLLKGRVISAYKQSRPRAKNNWLKNLFAAVRRYSVTTLPNVQVNIGLGENQLVVETDQDGIFEAMMPDPGELVSQASFELDRIPGIKVKDAVLDIQRFYSERAVISDIDDTILISHSTVIGKKFWLSVSKNAYTRRPFPGVSDFYQKLTHQGKHPLFYVSSSDWSLFDLIKDFLRFREIPLGPLLLKDQHVNLKNIWKSGGESHLHKLEKIRMLFSMFPHTNWVLIGDSGQHDPEIYQEVWMEYPGRILAVVIRVVNPSKQEDEVKRRLEKFPQFFFVKTTEEAIKVAEKEKLFY
ncbi:App1 family protein [Algoriphagus jejuensis]|uniref:App1 family protein n=1 Tax=Algoriphagus jejuensis TaxID=419934 RepID=A0ABP3YI85_9BACT